MRDHRLNDLASLLVNHSMSLVEGEHVLIEAFDVPEEMVLAVIERVRKAGANPHVALRNNRIQRALVEDASDGQLDTWADYDLSRMKQMDAYLALRGSDNISEMAAVPPESIQAFGRLYGKPVHHGERVNNTKWCVLRWPSPSMAQLAGMSTPEFEDFYFRVCTLDYAKMETAAQALATRMASVDSVRVQGPGATDLTFSIVDIPKITCCGDKNIPDGEVFTAPVRDSINGVLEYNTPTIYNGISFENVRFTFANGRIEEATSSSGNNEDLNKILDTDDGARYIGEFAIGFNPHILHAMKDILFDEKIAGSFHFTPGNAYEQASNGNNSEIHWDLVCIQRPEYGGGTIAFDGEVVRRDGLFVVADLLGLNPENLS
jgi:aminopeptidase